VRVTRIGGKEEVNVAKRLGLIGISLLVFVLLVAAVALASGATGVGQTPLNAALGFTIHSDLTGELTYVSDPNGATPGFFAQCDDFTTYKIVTTKAGYPRVQVTATCSDGGGSTVYLRASFTDKGEPGDRDTVCVIWSYSSPAKKSNAYIHDMGVISNGNIQIIQNADGTTSVKILTVA
jgi:hypothetical protein